MTGQPLNSVPQEYFQQASEHYGIKFEDLTLIGGLENWVYAFQKDNRDYVLRVGHSTHLSFELVQAEVDWLLYLLEGNVPVTQPILSESGVYVEKIIIDETYLNVVAFEKAEGQHLDFATPNEWDKAIIRQWGKYIGRMHALTKDYSPRNSFRRYDFEPLMDVERLLSHKGKETVQRITSLFRELEELPKTKDSYGLVHSDLHPGNFLIDSKKNKIVCLLDFDRACYKWFISEIAIALYYPLYLSPLRQNPEAQKTFLRFFLPVFWEGYEMENQLDPFWKETLNAFIKVRDAILYMYLPAEQAQRTLDEIKKRVMGNTYMNVLEI